MKNLTAGIDSDGISENHDIETYYHQCSGAMVDEDHEFLELTFENGGIDGVTRIGLDELKELGFVQSLITPPSDGVEREESLTFPPDKVTEIGRCRVVGSYTEPTIPIESESDTEAVLAEALDQAFLKCPKCNDGCMGTDITDETIDCHYCDTDGRITAQAFCEQHDKMQALVGDAMVNDFELKSMAEALAKARLFVAASRKHPTMLNPLLREIDAALALRMKAGE